MRFTTLIAASAVAGSTLAKDITVGVGKTGLTFEPAEITAEEGDTIHFKFWPKNHSVAQAAFAKPCEPSKGGFWSGFVPTTDTAKAADTAFMYTVTNASAPIWFYCTQGKHCQEGMVGVINAPSQGNKTLDAFKKAAIDAAENLSPSSTAGQGGELMDATSMPSATPTPSTGAASAFQVNSFTFSGVIGMFAYMLL